jgi:hypothetical protein
MYTRAINVATGHVTERYELKFINQQDAAVVSIYVVQSSKALLECDMEYGEGKEVTCIVDGVDARCLEETVKKLGYGDYTSLENNKLYISTSIFKAGKTPGELIRELATLLRFC